MRIGELAKQTGTAIETIRFYEREGLLPAPSRTSSGYRSYVRGHAEELAFIRHCRSLDMSLADIKTLLDYRRHPELECREVNSLLDSHVALVAQRIEHLQALQGELQGLQKMCDRNLAARHCGILQSLSSQTRPTAGNKNAS